MRKSQRAIVEKRRILLGRLTKLRDVLAGNLVSAQARSKPKGKIASAAYGPVWMLTWKQEGKTKTLYVRISELERVRQGVDQMKRMKEIVRLIAEINMQLLLAARKEQ